MILSIHIPKTAGTSFGKMLRDHYGQRVLFDYGDWTGYDSPEAIRHREARYAEVASRADELARCYEVIHGHFKPSKYLRFFPAAQVVVFFRNPFQQSISNYEYLRRNPQIPHPAVRVFHESGMSFEEYLAWPDVRNPQSNFLGDFPVESLSLAGITEQFDRSVLLFNKLFHAALGGQYRENPHPGRQGNWHPVSPETRRAVETWRREDLETYRRAIELFEAQARHAGI